MKRLATSAKLRLESLEERLPFAGDIDAHAIGNVLYITGGSVANGLAIHTSSTGVIELIGLDADGAATTVNSHASESFVRIQDLIINMGSGADILLMTDLTINGSATIKMGGDNDFVGLGQIDKDDDLVNGVLDDLGGIL